MKAALQPHTNKSKLSQNSASQTAWLRLITSLGGGLLLGALSLSAHAGSLISHTEYLEYELPKNIEEKCAAHGNCPEIEVKYLKTNHPWINKLTNERINHLVVNSKPTESAPITKKSGPADVKAAIDGFVNSQFADLPEDSVFVYNLMVRPEYLGHVNDFELFEISSYVYTGGAHGMPYSEYLVFDQQSKKQIQLADMLQPNKKPRFKALAYDAYKNWVKTVDEDVASYEKSWPFTLSDNVTLTDKGVDIRYQHYSISPYAYGMPVLSIPYEKLGGIIKPRFIPK